MLVDWSTGLIGRQLVPTSINDEHSICRAKWSIPHQGRNHNGYTKRLQAVKTQVQNCNVQAIVAARHAPVSQQQVLSFLVHRTDSAPIEELIAEHLGLI